MSPAEIYHVNGSMKLALFLLLSLGRRNNENGLLSLEAAPLAPLHHAQEEEPAVAHDENR